MNAQKVTTINIEIDPWVQPAKTITATLFVIMGAMIKLDLFPESMNNNIGGGLSTLFLFIIGCTGLYLYVIKKPYTENGYLIIDNEKIDIYSNNYYSETFPRNQIQHIDLSDINEFTPIDLFGPFLTKRLSFELNNKTCSIDLLFDRKQRMDEFYTRFNMTAPAVLVQ